MKITCFYGDYIQGQFDRQIIEFNDTPDLPAPPTIFILEHFRQTVLQNMRGDGHIPNVDSESDDPAQRFESGDGKAWFERNIADKLVPGVDDSDTAHTKFWLTRRCTDESLDEEC